jgi:hypothetical protein
MRLEYDNSRGVFKYSDDLKNDKIHMVFVAVNALTNFNAFAVEHYDHETEKGISLEQATILCNVVNEKNETGTLFPKLNITILPLSKYNNRDDWDNENSMEKNIKDAFKENLLHIKSNEMIFALEGRHDFNKALAIRVLKKVAREQPKDGILKKIYHIW